MSPVEIVVLFVAAAIAGAMNSVAGGGSFISYPALLGIATGLPGILEPSKLSNSTNAVALWPGSLASVGAYRAELARPSREMIALVIISLVGGAVGAYILRTTPELTFNQLLPWLLLFAALLFTFGRNLSAGLRRGLSTLRVPAFILSGLVLLLQLFVAVYGGFFGAGIGIMMLAVLTLTGMENIHKMNALKTLLATCINGSAILLFALTGAVLWPQALLMIVGATLGGYYGAFFAQKINPKYVRWLVIAITWGVTAIFFARTYLSGS